MAVTPIISRIVSINRNQGSAVPDAINLTQWCDSIDLSSGTAQSYAIKEDTVGGVGGILRITSNVGPVYINPYAVATVPGATTTNGLSSIMLNPQTRPVVLAIPAGCTAISFIAPANTIVTVEAWN